MIASDITTAVSVFFSIFLFVDQSYSLFLFSFQIVSYNAAAHACVQAEAYTHEQYQDDHCNRPSDERVQAHQENNGQGEQGWSLVLGLMTEMRKQGLKPDMITYSTAITACGKAGQLERALSFLDEIETGSEGEVAPDVVAINAAIAACAIRGDSEKALELLDRMMTSSGKTVGSVSGRSLSAHKVSDEADRSPSNNSNLKERQHGTKSASTVYRGSGGGERRAKWPLADAASFNSAMEAFAKAGQWQTGVSLLALMPKAGLAPDICSYASSLACFRAGGEWKRSLKLLEEMETAGKKGVSPDLGCYGAVITTLGEAGEWQQALELLRRLERDAEVSSGPTDTDKTFRGGAKTSSPTAGPNLVCYNAVMAALSRASAWSPALDLLEELEGRGIFDIKTFNCAIHACRGGGQWAKATALLSRMIAQDETRGSSPGSAKCTVPPPDAYSFASAIMACGTVGQADRALEVLHVMKTVGVRRNIAVYNTAMAAIAKGVSCQSSEAKSNPSTVVEDLDGSSSTTNGSSNGDAVSDDGLEARATEVAASATAKTVTTGDGQDSWKRTLDLLLEMRKDGVMPDVKTYNTVLAAYQRSGAWKSALDVLGEMKQGRTTRPLTPGESTGEASADPAAAPLVWIGEPVPSPDLVSFNTAMGACGKGGQWAEALRMLEEIEIYSFTPNLVSYNTAAVACARSKKWDLALQVINRGRQVGIIPLKNEKVRRAQGNENEGALRVGRGRSSVGNPVVSNQRWSDASGFYSTVEAMARQTGSGGRIDSNININSSPANNDEL